MGKGAEASSICLLHDPSKAFVNTNNVHGAVVELQVSGLCRATLPYSTILLSRLRWSERIERVSQLSLFTNDHGVLTAEWHARAVNKHPRKGAMDT